MRVSFVSIEDPTDVQNWSGTFYHMSRALRLQTTSLHCVGPLRDTRAPLTKGKQLFYEWLLKKSYGREYEPGSIRNYGRQIAAKIADVEPDVVLSAASVPIAYLECEPPIALWVDATFAGLVNYYPTMGNFCSETINNAHAHERATLQRCDVAIYSSDWAARTAIDNYPIDPAKVRVVPYGANIEREMTEEEVDHAVAARASNECKLLFVGKEWWRKGGDVALAVAEELNRAGLKTELTIMGCCPPANRPVPSFVRQLGSISKATELGRQRFARAMMESHFLILPSRADCTPMVLSEANAFGVPCLAPDTGGISSILRPGINGELFDRLAKAADYCQYIDRMITDSSAYAELARSAYQEYRSRLNWSVAIQSVLAILRELVP